MLRMLWFSVLLAAGPVSAQVRIHDPVVRMLAKPYGIEERIRLASIDDMDFGPEGSGRLTLSLANSGVKEVRLEHPEFRMEVRTAEGQWVDLGRLEATEILFPLTGDDRSVTRKYVVDFKPASASAEVVKRLRQAAAEGRRFRLVGRAGLRVALGESRDFHRNSVTLELGGLTRLAKTFSPRWHRNSKALPAIGFRK